MAQTVNHLPKIRESRLRPLGQEDPLEKRMATHSSLLAWRIPWTEEPGELHGVSWRQAFETVHGVSKRVGHG